MKSMFQRPAAMAVATSLALSVIAASAARADEREASEVEGITVTATRSRTAIEDSLVSVTVLTRADIERSQSPDLLDLLGRQAGIDIARSGGPGSQSSLFLRGGESDHALVLIDGVRVNTATQGVFDLAHLPLASIERIEIVRGPRAALWGSDAIGGVVQVFTRGPREPVGELRAGSYGRFGFDAGFGIEGGAGGFALSAGSEDIDGFSATGPAAFGHDPDADGYRNRHLSLRAHVALGTQRLALRGLLTEAEVDFDQGRTWADNQEFALSLAGELGDAWSHSLSLGHAREDLDTPAYGSRFGSRRDSLDWLHHLRLAPGQALNFGLNWSEERGYSTDSFSGSLFDRERRNTGLFLGWLGEFGAQRAELSLRRDDNGQFGGATTAQAAWGVAIDDRLRLRLGWGQGFRAPNFNELYYPGFFGFYAGNPGLRPERSHSLEFGLAWTPDARSALSLSLYRSRVRDLVAFEGPLFSAVNVDRAAVDGAELEYRWSAGDWSLQANATWQHARDLDGGAELLRRAPRKLNLGLDRGVGGGWRLGLDAMAVAARPDFGGDLAGFGRVDLRLERELAPGWVLQARIENLGDRDYAWVAGYNTPGRSGMLTLRYGGGE